MQLIFFFFNFQIIVGPAKHSPAPVTMLDVDGKTQGDVERACLEKPCDTNASLPVL